LEGFASEDLDGPITELCEEQINWFQSLAEKSARPIKEIKADAENARLLFKSLVAEGCRRAENRTEMLYTLADLLSTAPEEMRDCKFAMGLAEKAVSLRQDDLICRQSLAWALYRAGDFERCIDSAKKVIAPTRGKLGDGFAAMAYCQTGEIAKAHEVLKEGQRWLAEREEANDASSYPPLSMWRRIYAEANALISANRSSGNGNTRRNAFRAGPPD
jgi:hypothetical protein